jgi:hypothetical protein
MSDYTSEQLQLHHRRCNGNREALRKNDRAGCFQCLEVFSSSEVVGFVCDGNDAYCPKCGVDSVIVDDGIHEFSLQLLQALQYEYFEREPEVFIGPPTLESFNRHEELARYFKALVLKGR